MICQISGFPPISTIGLGLISVSSARRVPMPPAKMTTFMWRSRWQVHEVPLGWRVQIQWSRTKEVSQNPETDQDNLRAQNLLRNSPLFPFTTLHRPKLHLEM